MLTVLVEESFQIERRKHSDTNSLIMFHLSVQTSLTLDRNISDKYLKFWKHFRFLVLF